MSRLFFFKQKTAYEMRISDWSSDVCSADLIAIEPRHFGLVRCARLGQRLKPARLLHHRGNFGGEMSRQRHRGDFRIISVANWANFAVEMGAEIGQRLCAGFIGVGCRADLAVDPSQSGLRLLEPTRKIVSLLQSTFMRGEHTLHPPEVPADPAGETPRAFATASLLREREIGAEWGDRRAKQVGLGTQ